MDWEVCTRRKNNKKRSDPAIDLGWEEEAVKFGKVILSVVCWIFSIENIGTNVCTRRVGAKEKIENLFLNFINSTYNLFIIYNSIKLLGWSVTR